MPFRSQNVWSKTSRMLNSFGCKGGASKEVMRSVEDSCPACAMLKNRLFSGCTLGLCVMRERRG